MKRKALVVVLTALGFSTGLSGAILASDKSERDQSYMEDLADTFMIATAFAGIVSTMALIIDGLLRRAR